MTEDLQTRAGVDYAELAHRIVCEFRSQGWPAKEAEIARLIESRFSLALTTERDAALARVEADVWQPIETAPKDGRAIIAWCVHPYASSMTEPENYVGPVVAHWIDHNKGGWTWHGHLGNFTHWMPLPAAPAEEPRP